ncbi:Arc family DNA-binding protein [Thermaerobacter sp. PB12/4term]|uniref:ribbon-helix-helix domain-containing protein n=1 Tax=Thermaerobacter sp. PB12/4term TaxID=2293838 RepID=UPI000E32CFB8|nr:Arc family DNA-binding protein [Thermaerobacter sp. PB12/4term]QIA26420.1 Arc family DNA-binding protein [Thermaerobacter sp. PB12/4term]
MPEKKRFLLRIAPEIYEALQRWADDEWRSVNGQIEYLLREALRRAGRLPGPRGRDRPPGTDGGDTGPSPSGKPPGDDSRPEGGGKRL